VIDLVAHLDTQIASAKRLLQLLLAQTDAIRRQDVEGVLARLADVQIEFAARDRLEREREGILREAAATLGLRQEAVELDDILMLVGPAEVEPARRKSAELKGLLAELTRVHTENRVLIRQELAFLDHLVRALSGQPQTGYSPRGSQAVLSGTSTMDARA
jgi:hypothetical protein